VIKDIARRIADEIADAYDDDKAPTSEWIAKVIRRKLKENA
jgi:hypothetical protein